VGRCTRARARGEAAARPPCDEATAPLLTNVVHWLYGTGWGAAYGLLRRTLGGPAVAVGTGFGTAVWTAGYAQLGVGVAVTYAALDR